MIKQMESQARLQLAASAAAKPRANNMDFQSRISECSMAKNYSQMFGEN
jgi:hypothetical protein